MRRILWGWLARVSAIELKDKMHWLLLEDGPRRLFAFRVEGL